MVSQVLRTWGVGGAMNEEIPVATVRERLERLECTLYWHKVGWGLLVAVLVAWLIPPIGHVVGFGMLFLFIGGSVVVFITAIICLLDRCFPGKPSDD